MTGFQYKTEFSLNLGHLPIETSGKAQVATVTMVATFSEHDTFHSQYCQTSLTCLGLGAAERHPACQQPGVQAEDSGPGVLDREGGGVPRHPAQILPVKGRQGQGKLPRL